MSVAGVVFALCVSVGATQAAQPAASPAVAAAQEAAALFEKGENEQALAAYDRAVAADLGNAEYRIGRGRTLARLRKYDEAIAAYGEAIRLRPGAAAGYRWRGHAYINTRKLDLALADLTKAEALDQSDYGIYYHLALAHYLRGEFDAAAVAYQGCLRTSRNDEDRVSCSAWLYPSLVRAGRADEAKRLLDRITPDLAVKENLPYLNRLLLFKGALSEEQVAAGMSESPLNLPTVAYGVGLWHLLSGRTSAARAYFEKAVASDYWPAFGVVASEVELKRLK